MSHADISSAFYSSLDTNATVTPIQRKFEVSQPGDEYEREADSVAEAIMRMPDPGEESTGESEMDVVNEQNAQPRSEESLQRISRFQPSTPMLQRKGHPEAGVTASFRCDLDAYVYIVAFRSAKVAGVRERTRGLGRLDSG